MNIFLFVALSVLALVTLSYVVLTVGAKCRERELSAEVPELKLHLLAIENMEKDNWGL